MFLFFSKYTLTTEGLDCSGKHPLEWHSFWVKLKTSLEVLVVCLKVSPYIENFLQWLELYRSIVKNEYVIRNTYETIFPDCLNQSQVIQNLINCFLLNLFLKSQNLNVLWKFCLPTVKHGIGHWFLVTAFSSSWNCFLISILSSPVPSELSFCSSLVLVTKI